MLLFHLGVQHKMRRAGKPREFANGLFSRTRHVAHELLMEMCRVDPKPFAVEMLQNKGVPHLFSPPSWQRDALTWYQTIIRDYRVRTHWAQPQVHEGHHVASISVKHLTSTYSTVLRQPTTLPLRTYSSLSSSEIV